MAQPHNFPERRSRSTAMAAGAALSLLALPGAARADGIGFGTLFVTSSRYAGNSGTIMLGQALPNSNGAKATADGTYPNVFSNDAVDGNFGITAPIQLTAALALSLDAIGVLVGPPTGSLDITRQTGIATSYSSKSELAINASADGRSLTFMGYDAPVDAIDVSNSNTPHTIDPTNSDIATAVARAVVQVDLGRGASKTDVDAYSGNNGRAAALIGSATSGSGAAYVMVGNAGNGSGIEPQSVVASTGVQTIAPGASSAATTVVGAPQGTYGTKNGFQYGFAIQNIGDPADKSGKDDNFRGLTVFDGAIYFSKGSGGNGVDTVYQVTLPGGTANLAADASKATIGILPGFPTTPASGTPTFFPFGIWFANATTLYVGDEGNQSLTPDANAGLQKWVFDGTNWKLAYVLQNGLKLGQTTPVANYPTIDAPATTGLRNIAGHVQGNTVTIFAATATFSGLADPGADPNSLVEIVDTLNATTAPATASFRTLGPATAGLVYRGVAYVPCDTLLRCAADSRITAH